MSDELLEIEMRLLILRYGRPKVLRTFARLSELSVEELEQRLRAVEQRPKAKRPKLSAMDVFTSEFQDHHEIARTLRALAVDFDNHTFLPHLRDVQRFLDRIGSPAGKLKSRAAAAPFLMRALARLTSDDLGRLLVAGKSTADSDYSLLARAIMNSPAKKSPRFGESGGDTKD